jgi:predicted acyl esterase
MHNRNARNPSDFQPNVEFATDTFYGYEALAWQQRFLDHFLTDIHNGIDRLPRVRLEIRKAFYRQEVRSEESWPLPSVRAMGLYLCANMGSLQTEPASLGLKRFTDG